MSLIAWLRQDRVFAPPPGAGRRGDEETADMTGAARAAVAVSETTDDAEAGHRRQ